MLGVVRFLMLVLLVLNLRIDAAESAIPLMDVHFSALSWEPFKEEGIKVDTGNGVKELRISHRARMPAMRYVGTNPIVFFRERTVPESEAPVRVPVAVARIPEGMRRVMLFFIPTNHAEGENEGLLYRVIVLDDSLEAFPKGGYRFMSASKSKLSVLFDKARFQLNPGEQYMYKPTVKEREKVALVVGIEEDGRTVTNKTFFHDDYVRWFVLICQEENKGGRKFISFRAIPEYFPNPDRQKLLLRGE